MTRSMKKIEFGFVFSDLGNDALEAQRRATVKNREVPDTLLVTEAQFRELITDWRCIGNKIFDMKLMIADTPKMRAFRGNLR